MKSNAPLPTKLADPPHLDPWLEWYFNAFLDLGSCRSGMGDGPIMWTAIDEYAKRHGLASDDEYMFFKDLINALDSAYTDFQRKKSNAGNNLSGGQGKPAVQTKEKQPRGRS